MQKLYVDSRKTEDEEGKTRSFDYYILVGEIDAGPFFCESYGLGIEEQGAENICEIPNITTSAARIDVLIGLVLRNRVTPINLPEVLADWL